MESSNQNQLTSRIGIQFGEEIVGNGQNFFNISFILSKEHANNVEEDLKQKTGEEIDVEWGFVVAFSVNPENANSLVEIIKDVYEKQADNESFIDQRLFELSQTGQIQYKVTYRNGKVYLSLRPSPDLLETVQEQFEAYAQQGLAALAENQTNKIEINIKQNRSFIDIIEQALSGKGLGSCLLEQASAELKISLNDQVFNSVEEILSAIDQDIANQPAMLALKFAKNFEIDLKFASTAELPENFQKYVFTPLPLRDLKNDGVESSQQQGEPKFFLGKLLRKINEDFEIYVTIPDFAVLQIQSSAPNIRQFFTKVSQAKGLNEDSNDFTVDLLKQVIKNTQ